MIEKNENDLKSYVQGTVSKKQFAELKHGLESANGVKAEKIKTIQLKKPSVTTALSAVFGLFGGGSFYLGQVKRGIAKIAFNVVVPILIICIFLVTVAPNYQKYSDQATTYDEEVVQVLNSDNNDVYTSYSNDYNTLSTYLTSIDSLLSELSDAYEYFNEDSDGMDLSAALVNLQTYLNNFYADYVAGVSSVISLTENIMGTIVTVIENSEEDLTGLVEDTVEVYFDEYEAAIDVLYDYIDGLTETVALSDIISDVKTAISSVMSYLDTTESTEENPNPDYVYVSILNEFLEALSLDEDGELSNDSLTAISDSKSGVYSAITYAYSVTCADYVSYIDAYLAVISEDVSDFVGTDEYEEALSGINTLMSWLIGDYVLPVEPVESDYEDEEEYSQKLEEYEAEYATVSATRSTIYTIWQNFYLLEDCAEAYTNLGVVSEISVPDALTVDTLVAYLKEFADTKYEMTSASIKVLLTNLEAKATNGEFISQIELFATYCEALNVFLSSKVSSAASSLSDVFAAMDLMLSGDIDELQEQIDDVTAKMEEIIEADSENYAKDENYIAYSEQLAEYNTAMSAYNSVISALSIDYDYVGSLKGVLASYCNDVTSASETLTAYYLNLVGYTDAEDKSNSVTGLLNEVVDGDMTVSSFITELTSMIDGIEDARKGFINTTYIYNSQSRSLLEITGIYVGILDGYADNLADWYDQAAEYLALTESNDGTLIGEVIRNKLYKDLSLTEVMTEITDYLKTVVDSDYYDVKYTNIQSAYDTTSNLSSSLSSKASYWQKVHDIVYMFFLVITITDAVIIAAYWVGEIFRDREKCHKMNYESIKKALEV